MPWFERTHEDSDKFLEIDSRENPHIQNAQLVGPK